MMQRGIDLNKTEGGDYMTTQITTIDSGSNEAKDIYQDFLAELPAKHFVEPLPTDAIIIRSIN